MAAVQERASKCTYSPGSYFVSARTTILRSAGVLALGFVLVQFVRPGLPNPPVSADLQAPSDIKKILQTSCYNCHSNETKLPWFDRVVPAYWIAANDVKLGRARLNFSEIGKLPVAQQKAALFESVSQIELGAMPLPAYKRIHPESVIQPDQLAALKSYLAPDRPKMSTDKELSAADAQYESWIQAKAATPTVAPAPNGIAFLSDYKNWKPISSTERLDNHTMRQILGNDVAVQAIAQNHINPWPDGAAFAKVAWWEQPDAKGTVRPGAFFQVEFMIRDSQKYAGTLGWGWARWRGAELTPYGKDASFTSECVGCHRALKDTNYVYTMPIRGQQ
jgi:heme-binding protein/cytochrome P460